MTDSAPVRGSHYTFFTAKERDTESGLDYFGARYFSGAQGRFTSVDPENAGASPEDPQSWNGYAYARNNPLVFTDPTGERYQRCVGQGDQQQCTEISDADWDEYKHVNRRELIFQRGKIFGRDKEGNQGSQVGSYNQLDVDLSPEAVQILREAGNRAARDIRTGAIAIGVFATSYASTYAIPAVVASLTALGETGAVGPGVGLLNKIHHIFGRARHNLGGLVQQYGSPAAAYSALEKATVQHVVGKGLTGQFKEVVNVGGTNVTVTGAVVNGVVKIGTAYR